MAYNPFHNNWLNYSDLLQNKFNMQFEVNLPDNFFSKLKFDQVSLREYRINAAIECAKTLGDNPALCISGGVDSQCMLQCWIEAGINFKVYCLVFNKDLNKHDVEYAYKFCELYQRPLEIINYNIVHFLTNKNYDVGLKYHSMSPHFNVHYDMFDLLITKGHTGVCAGGQVPTFNNNVWGENFSMAAMNFLNYIKVTNFKCQGSFLSFYPELAWAIAILSPQINLEITHNPKFYAEFHENKSIRYLSKTIGYKKAGFNIIPQPEKYTGFELVKKYFENITGDGWEFEKRFRHPLENKFKNNGRTSKFIINDKLLSDLTLVYNSHHM